MLRTGSAVDAAAAMSSHIHRHAVWYGIDTSVTHVYANTSGDGQAEIELQLLGAPTLSVGNLCPGCHRAWRCQPSGGPAGEPDRIGGGGLVDNGDSTWSFTPASNDDTSVSFSYPVTDGSLTAAGSASVTSIGWGGSVGTITNGAHTYDVYNQGSSAQLLIDQSITRSVT